MCSTVNCNEKTCYNKIEDRDQLFTPRNLSQAGVDSFTQRTYFLKGDNVVPCSVTFLNAVHVCLPFCKYVCCTEWLWWMWRAYKQRYCCFKPFLGSAVFATDECNFNIMFETQGCWEKKSQNVWVNKLESSYSKWHILVSEPCWVTTFGLRVTWGPQSSDGWFIHFSSPAVKDRWSGVEFLMTEKTNTCHTGTLKPNTCHNTCY